MHTIKIKVDDSVYAHIMYLLNSLNREKVEIIEENKQNKKLSTKESIKKLFQNKKVKIFEDIEDPVAWQREQRDEW